MAKGRQLVTESALGRPGCSALTRFSGSFDGVVDVKAVPVEAWEEISGPDSIYLDSMDANESFSIVQHAALGSGCSSSLLVTSPAAAWNV